MVLDMTHYGINLHTGNMAGNIYLNFLLYSLVDFPGYALCFTIDRFGRKKIYTLCLVTGGLACLSTLFVHLYGEEDATYSYYVKMALSTVGKLGIAAAYGISYIWGVELFPTVVRNFSLGLGSVASCAGAILTPIVVREVKADSIGEDTLPLVIFGVAAIFGAICTIPLPETTNRDLPETIEDAENFQRRTKRKLDEKEYHISPTIEMMEMPRKNASATSRLSI
ncbi:organic cation transporter protein-like [Lingula anatina]|uniref:Organic cation transporter protein-like n=1 Tax=Lingula anatina TaxID=7574 RepID=A0A1S3JSY4_LINAN|nr:organic cation transporter protein-like [Lingula anatina]|eukprot:XP_013413463.1 organic cation transporter protein-like [Lingula anatina]